MPQLDKENFNALELELYNKLKQIKDDEDWLYYRFCSLNTEERQKVMLEFLENKPENYDPFEVSLEAVYIANRNPREELYPVVREELETELEKRLYDKLTQIHNGECWLSYIFSCLYTEDIALKILGYINEGHDNFADIFGYAARIATDYHHRNCDWYDPNDISENYDDEEDDYV